ncbi:MAG: MlaD family protein, partial [bacterium]
MKTETRVGIFILGSIVVFLYLSINIKLLRLDQHQYYEYKTYFDDTGGLEVKAPVRIAGVDVGWVDNVLLHEGGKAEVNIRINKKNKLARNAYGTIAQEGLIGTKILEIYPGDPSTGLLMPGSTLSMPGKSPASVGELLDQFKGIATSIQDLATSLRSVFATPQGEQNMKLALDGVAKASNRIADFSEVLDRTLKKNEENLNSTLVDMRKVMGHLDLTVPSFRKDFDKITLAFADDTLPKLSDASEKAGGAFQSLDETSVQAKETFKEAEQVAEKINTGKGVLGKLINEDETYYDLKQTIKGFKDYVGKAQTLAISVDMRSETLVREWLGKGYVDLKIRPNDDYFYMFQIGTDEFGSMKRQDTIFERMTEDGTRLIPEDYLAPELAGPSKGGDVEADNRTAAKIALINNPDRLETTTRTKNDIFFGFQFGKRFDRLVLRAGLYENTFGIGADYYAPTPHKKFNFITSLD